jgi:predicted component of type VI protein secretion system
MIDFTPLLQAIIGAAIGGISAYIAIRTDLANLKARMENTEKAADNAHDRIDKILMNK